MGRRTDGFLRHFGSDHQLLTKSRRFIDMLALRSESIKFKSYALYTTVHVCQNRVEVPSYLDQCQRVWNCGWQIGNHQDWSRTLSGSAPIPQFHITENLSRRLSLEANLRLLAALVVVSWTKIRIRLSETSSETIGRAGCREFVITTPSPWKHHIHSLK